MPAGTIRDVVICVPGATGTQGPCPAGAVQQVITGYVVDPAAASYIDAVAAPYDYAAGAQLWAYGFAFTLGVYLAAHCIGVVLGRVRRG